ncbi:hypothetical protein RS75_23585 [Rhizobium nepotum 39/7]|uniref:Uncharacterized protein n=1 Tax=Rhizobium nepotum 39/7 TaxID=1368418 RepID=A0ABR5CKU6_9HYPH|nr:hypothetical protein RS75_23585 [Rhizobium nepotum 39/7]
MHVSDPDRLSSSDGRYVPPAGTLDMLRPVWPLKGRGARVAQQAKALWGTMKSTGEISIAPPLSRILGILVTLRAVRAQPQAPQ